MNVRGCILQGPDEVALRPLQYEGLPATQEICDQLHRSRGSYCRSGSKLAALRRKVEQTTAKQRALESQQHG